MQLRAQGNSLTRVAIIIEENPKEETSPSTSLERLETTIPTRYMNFQEKIPGLSIRGNGLACERIMI